MNDAIPQDEYLQILEEAANSGNLKSMLELAPLYEKQKDMENAFKWYKRLADFAVPMAQFKIGDFYENGIVVPADEEVAIKWYREAAKVEFPDAVQRLKEKGLS